MKSRSQEVQFFMFIALAITVFVGCTNHGNKKLFKELSSKETNIAFVNEVTDAEDFNIFGYRNFYNGGGVAIGDVNNDMLPDIFLVSNLGDNRLYINLGNFKFEDVTESAGIDLPKAWSTGVTFADINGDGFLDIYVCNSGNKEFDDRSNHLYINNGDVTFTEKAKAYGLDDKGFSTHAAFFDYDRDGDLDMYLLNNSFIPVSTLNYRNLRNQRDALGGHKLFRNDGEKFTDVSQSAGIYGSIIGFGLGITVGDVNDDNWLDIYVSNDFYERDYLYINNRDGTFSDEITDQMPHISLSSMGADIADINNDGTLDIFVTDMLPGNDAHLKQISSFEGYDLYQRKLSLDYHHQIMQNMLQMNNGDGTFSEVARMAGVEATDWSWGALIFDMNNDGLKDIFVANGILKDLTDQDFLRYMADKNRMEQVASGRKFNYKEFLDNIPSRPIANYAFENTGHLAFVNRSTSWGLEGPGFSNGAAYGDLDNDGDLDLVVNNVNSPVSIFKNQSIENIGTHYLRVHLKGSGMNRNGVGTKVKVYRNRKLQYLQQMPNRGFQSSVDHSLIFGLGNDGSVVDSVEVIWADDRKEIFRNVAADTLLIAEQRNATLLFPSTPTHTETPFVDATEESGITYTHLENQYVDFYRDPLLKQMYSTLGPSLTVGDVNGDGLDDVFVGTALGNPLKLFLQNRNGTFYEGSQTVFKADTLSEIVAATLQDVDNDHDLDLFVVTGGSEFNRDDPTLRDKLYLNDGKGNFVEDSRFPHIASFGSCVAASDFDKDGDIDFFVGSRMLPEQYGLNPPSYLYVNDGTGGFKNYTKRLLGTPDLGMVTDAAWVDVNGDSYPDLIVVGDWMPVVILINEGGKKFTPLNEPVPYSEGWWNCIKPIDVDQDGDIDFVLGNLGHNTRIRADSLHPAELYVKDFDNNGAIEQIMTCVSEDGRNYPMVLKHDLERQLPFIKKRFQKYSDYAGKGIDEVFSATELKGAIVKKVYTTSSSILINHGTGRFSLAALPREAQVSPIYAIETMDFDHDGIPDILLAGNFFEVLPEIGRYDASYGLVLRGLGNGNFTPITPVKSGFLVKGQVRKMGMVNTVSGKRVIIAKNGARLQVLKALGTPEIRTTNINHK